MSVDTTAKSHGVAPFSEDEQHVAGNAHSFFKACQYDATIGILKKLSKSHPNDARVAHNKALTEFCKSSKTKVADFKKNLSKIQKVLQQSTKDEDDFVTSAEKTNYAVLHFNQALMFYSMHQYSEAENILEQVYENCDITEDLFILRLCLLLAETYLTTYNVEKAGKVIAATEKTFLTAEEANSNPRNGGNEEKAKETAILSAFDAESLRSYLRILKVRHLLQLRSIKPCKREMKLLAGVGGQSTPSQQLSASAVTSLFLKSNFEFVRSNHHKAFKLLGSHPPPYQATSEDDPHHCPHEPLPTMYYNNMAVIHFGMGKYHAGTFYLQKALHENESVVTSVMKQHQQQSGTRHQQQQNAKPIDVLHMNKRYELLYNCGLLLLHAGHSSPAFECLIAIVPVFHSNPRLWLRVAECCIQKCTGSGSHEETSGKSKSGRKSNAANPGIFTMIGSGVHRKVVINSPPSATGGKNNNLVMPAPTFEFASVCLNNALIVLQQSTHDSQQTDNEESDSDQQKPNDEKNDTPIVHCLPGPPVTGDDVMHLHASILVNSAFVALQLGNGLLAMHRCQALLRLPNLTGCHRYLGHMYLAEALVCVDKISDAIEYLNPDKTASISTTFKSNGKTSDDDGGSRSNPDNSGNRHRPPWQHSHSPYEFPSTLRCAHAYMTFNLATSHCLRSELDKAQRLLHHGSTLITHVPRQALLLFVYLCLNGRGNPQQAVQALKRNSVNPASNQQSTRVGNGHRGFSAVPAAGSASSSGSSSSDIPGSRSKTSLAPHGSAADRGGKGKNEGKGKRNRR